jgi:hypothetical protein
MLEGCGDLFMQLVAVSDPKDEAVYTVTGKGIPPLCLLESQLTALTKHFANALKQMAEARRDGESTDINDALLKGSLAIGVHGIPRDESGDIDVGECPTPGQNCISNCDFGCGGLRPTVVGLIKLGKKIQAIKELRQNRGLGLKEAKDAVEDWDRAYYRARGVAFFESTEREVNR